MTYSLLDHPNPNGSHFYTSRNEPIIALVVHITAGLQDLDTIDDHSAENTAAYASNTEREVSWHAGGDADSVIELLPPEYTAWHVIGYNSCTYGFEISKTHTDWRSAPVAWVAATLRNAGRHLGPIARHHGIPLRKATRAELDEQRANYRAGRPWKPVGFISHAELQPADRTDPGWVQGVGDTFPWGQLLANAQEEDQMSPVFDGILLPPTAPDEFNRVNIPLPWNGEYGMVTDVFACIIAADQGMTIRLAHWQVRPAAGGHPEQMVPNDTELAGNFDTGGLKAPRETRSLVIEYSAQMGGSVAIEAR